MMVILTSQLLFPSHHSYLHTATTESMKTRLQWNIQGGSVEHWPSALSSLPFPSTSFGDITDKGVSLLVRQNSSFYLLHLPQSICELWTTIWPHLFYLQNMTNQYKHSLSKASSVYDCKWDKNID